MNVIRECDIYNDDSAEIVDEIIDNKLYYIIYFDINKYKILKIEEYKVDKTEIKNIFINKIKLYKNKKDIVVQAFCEDGNCIII